MKTVALSQAEARLKKARIALAKLDPSAEYATFADAWSDFLLASNGVYSKLEEGAKGCGRSEGWFGRKKHGRKNDALLSYIHHARNEDEHGLEQSTWRRGTAEVFAPLSGYIKNLIITMNPDGSVEMEGDDESVAAVRVSARARLKAVIDQRYKDRFEPPAEHLGKPLGDIFPEDVARLFLTYLEGLIAEAGKLPQRP